MNDEMFPTTTTEIQVDQPATVHIDHFLLATKLTIPPVRFDVVARPQLISKLQLHRPLTLVAAAAGFGKTTLLSTAIQQYQWPTSWLSLDSGDDDLTRFWSYVFTSLESIQPGVSQTALALLQSPRQPAIETILTTLINNLMHLQQNVVLVLDDYHVITAQAIHASLTFLLEHLPSRLHLIIATRIDPPLPLARLRTHGQLTEIRSTDLRFTSEEVAAFLRQALGIDLAKEDIQALEMRTEGWIAGLQLAVLSMKGRDNLSSFIKAFTGSHRYIVDYLAQEVLTRQSKDVQTFLLQTSILDRLNGPLCEAVTGQEYGQSMLEHVEQANLFLLPLDDERHWYRYHHLFSELLRHRLRREQPDLVAVLHNRASTWYQQQQLIPESIQHALAAEDVQQAANLIESVGTTLTQRGEFRTLHTWLKALPAELVQSRLGLNILQGWLLFLTGQYAGAEQLLQELEQRYNITATLSAMETPATQTTPLPETMQALFPIMGELAAIRASIAIIQGDGPRTIELARQALIYLADDNTSVGMVTWFLGMAYWLAGDLEAAATTMADAYRRSIASGNMYIAFMALHELASLQAMQGHLHQAEQTYRQALQRANAQSGLIITTGPLYVGMGILLHEWNNLDTAERYLQEGIEQCLQMENARTALQGYFALVLTKQAQGDKDGTQTLLQKMTLLAQNPNLPPLTIPFAAAFQANLALMQGNEAAAFRWAQACGLHPSNELDHIRINEYLILARVQIAQRNLAEVLAWLQRLLPLAEAQELARSTMEIFILQALAYQAQDNTSMAIGKLENALALAEPEGYIRLFVKEGAPLAFLLEEVRARHLKQQSTASEAKLTSPIPYSLDYVEKLLAAFHEQEPLAEPTSQPSSPIPSTPIMADTTQSLAEELSTRERAVLRLLVAGYSNREIADELVIAVSTVKWYVNIIYSKLQVESRTKAIARARELGLI